MSMPDVPARIGVPVTRASNGTFWAHPMAAGRRGLWFEDTPEAVAEMREWVLSVIGPYTQYRGEPLDEIANAVLRALGFTDA